MTLPSAALRTASAWTAVLAGALSSLGCSSLTRPDEVAIVAEPLPAQRAPAAPGGAMEAAARPPARPDRAPAAAPADAPGCGN